MTNSNPVNRASRRSTRLLRICLVALSLALIGETSIAGEFPWPDRSGPTFDGNAAPEDAAGLPVEWDEKTDRNIAWKIPLHGEGHSTPVIGAGKAWFTTAKPDGTQQFIYCIDAGSGEVIDDKLLFHNADPEPLGNDMNSYASPSCVLERGAVYAHFGSYGTARLDPRTAEVVWQRRDIECRHFRGPGSSPVLFEDLMILTFDGIDRQFLTALDKRTGETVWRTERTTDYHDLGPDGEPIRDGDFRKAFSTPGLVEVDGRTQVVSVGSRAAFGYDARTGEELWTIEHENYNAAARPLFFENLAILNTGSRGAHLLAVRLDASTRGNVTETHVVWDRPRGNSRLPSPVLVDGRVYQVTDGGVASCIDARSGEEVWVGRLRGKFTASPVVANDRIYFPNEGGTTYVVKVDDEFKTVARNRLAEGMRASPATADGALYLRTFGHLYKIAAE